MTTAERDVRILRLFLIRRKAQRIKLVRVRPEFWVAVDCVRTNERDYVFWQKTTVHLDCCCGFTRHAPDGRIEAHRFVQYHQCVGQVFQVCNRWHLITQHIVQFLVEAPLDVRVLGQQVPGP